MPLLTIAQLPAPTSIESTGWLILALAGLAGMILVALKIALTLKALRAPTDAAVRVGPLPLEVRAASDYATKGEMVSLESRLTGEIHQLHGRISGLRSEVTDQINGLETSIRAELHSQRTETKADIGGVHDRINDVLGAVRELKGRIER